MCSICIHLKRGISIMIIEEFKSDATTIRVDDRDIVTKENNKERNKSTI